MDSRRIGQYREAPGSDIVKQGTLKKLKTMKKKYFALRATSSSGPSRLDYHDNEKKFRANQAPKRSIHLRTCFNINKKIDCKHKHALSIYLGSECFTVIADSELEQESWVDRLLEYQNEYLEDGEAPRPHYDYVWQGVIKKKSKTSCTQIEGPYRLCLANKEVSLVEYEKFHPSYVFQFVSIRGCGHSDNFFFMEVGRSAVTGSGAVWMQVDDTLTAKTMHDKILSEMASARNQSEFRRRSNTAGPQPSDQNKIRSRATSESYNSGSPRRSRLQLNRPPSTVVFSSNAAHNKLLGQLDDEEMRLRSGSTGSRTSTASHKSDLDEAASYTNVDPNSPTMVVDGPFLDHYMTHSDDHSTYLPMSPGQASMDHSSRSSTPPSKGQGQLSVDYMTMSPGQGQRSATPPAKVAQGHGQGDLNAIGGDFHTTTFGSALHGSLTPPGSRGQRYGSRSDCGSDYMPMTPGTPEQRSLTPSPTRLLPERPGSSNSESQDSGGGGRVDTYMIMGPGSTGGSPGPVQMEYMNSRTPLSVNVGNSSGYVTMTPPSMSTGPGYIDMTAGARAIGDLGPGYMVMEGKSSRMTAQIPIRMGKEPGYLDMVSTSQPLPTVKESGSGEAYLPMSPTVQSQIPMDALKPAKVYSYLSDDSVAELPKRAYSVGSRPFSKQVYKHHQNPETLRRQPLDSSKSSSAPHLIAQKQRGGAGAMHEGGYPHNPDGYQAYPPSPLSMSIRSEDSDSFVEMEFIRPRTASDSYGIRPRASSFGKQQVFTPHRPRSSSYGQSSKGVLRHIVANVMSQRNDSFESIGNSSMDYSGKRSSQESLSKASSCSRNSSNDSLKKLQNDESGLKKNLKGSDYIDMDFDKHSSCSPSVYSAISPQPDIAGYVDMTVGSTPKSQRGLSPCSSNHSLGSSPASSITQFNNQDKTNSGAKVIKASGKPVQKSVSKSPGPAGVGFTENQLTVARLKLADKRSPSSSGKESEDESYVPFKPSKAVTIGTSPVDMHHRGSHDWAMMSSNKHSKNHHGYSKSYDSAMMSPEANLIVGDPKVFNHRSSGKRDNRDRDDDSFRRRTNSNKEKRVSSRQVYLADKYHFKPEVKPPKERSSTSSLQDRVSKGQSPVLDRRIEYIPDNDIFSDKYFEKDEEANDKETSAIGTDIEEGYLEYLPGEILPVNEVPLSKRRGSSLKEKLKINSVIKDTKDAVNKTTKDDIKPEPTRRQFPDREYCEIEFPDQTTVSNSKSASNDIVKCSDKKGAVADAGLETSNTKDCNWETKSRESVISEKKPDSDYMESDPAPLTVFGLTPEPSTSVKSNKKIESDDFSYIDFDPETDRKRLAASIDSKECKKDVTIKTPGRVQSFISHDLDTDENKDDEIFEITDSKGIEILSQSGPRKSSTHSSDGVSVLERRNSSKDSPASPSRVGAKPELSKSMSQQSMESVGPSWDTSSDLNFARKTSHSSVGSIGSNRKGSQDSVSSLRLSSQSSQEGSVSSRKLSEDSRGGLLRKSSQGSQESIGSVRLCMLDKAQGKLVMKSSFPIAPEGKEVLDEGYCDITFEKVKEEKENAVNKEIECRRTHHRSGSDSSNNSDRSRKIFEGISTESSIPTPESIRCYIDDNSWDGMPVPEKPVSFISEESWQPEGAVGGKDIGSPLKQALTGRRSSPGVVKDSASVELLRNTVLTRGVSSSQASLQGFGVTRQTSAPVGPPKCNRLSNELPVHSRNRNTSAPAGVGLQSGGGTGAEKTAAVQANLEPCQDPQKQAKSMPCVTLPVVDKQLVASDLSKDSASHASRHSFTDLSQYEEMTFPASNLSQHAFLTRCSSQQQLHDGGANSMSDSSELQYADLDLMSSKENLEDKCRVKSRHTSSNNDIVQGSVPYAQIDYQRTETLKQDKDKDVKFTI